jgi:branched-chain amino acid transport system ATP-binding protein
MLLTVKGLNTHYVRAHVLHDVALDVGSGEVVALLGRNGAGKSTTLKSLMGLAEPSSGSIVFRGVELNGKKPYEISQLGLAYVPEDRRIFTQLTVDENLRIGYSKKEQPMSELLHRVFTLFPNLATMRKRLGSEMSGGEQQMLTVARALMGSPSCILLDEPFEGLSPVMVDILSQLIVDLKLSGLGILLAEPDFRLAEPLADRVCIIESGQVRYRGPAAELRDNDDLRERYLAL